MEQTAASAATLQVGPNPVASTLIVRTKGFEKNKRIFLAVTALSGSHIQQQFILSNQITTLDLTGLASGVYIVKIQFGTIELSERFIKF